MTRYALKNNQKIPYTAEQEAAADAEALEWADGQADRDLADLRTERNSLLAETDFYGNSDVTMSEAITTYRQALRDITNTYTSLNDVVWPVKP